jgi:hypothetical protein
MLPKRPWSGSLSASRFASNCQNRKSLTSTSSKSAMARRFFSCSAFTVSPGARSACLSPAKRRPALKAPISAHANPHSFDLAATKNPICSSGTCFREWRDSGGPTILQGSTGVVPRFSALCNQIRFGTQKRRSPVPGVLAQSDPGALWSAIANANRHGKRGGVSWGADFVLTLAGTVPQFVARRRSFPSSALE